MSGKKQLPKICWDSCIFIAWFKREQDKPLADIQLVLKDIVQKKAHLHVSTISYAEVLNTTKAKAAGDQFRKFAKRSVVSVVPVDARVAELAAVFRERSMAASNTPKLRAPDALIAATADLYGAELHSFDPDLRNLNGSPIINGLRVIAPCSISGYRAMVGSETDDDEQEEGSEQAD